MAESGGSHRKGIRRVLCCRYGIPPKSPENLTTSKIKTKTKTKIQTHTQTQIQTSSQKSSFPNSPNIHNNNRLGRGFIDACRILSPGRVSPIDTTESSPLPPSPPPAPPLPEMLPDSTPSSPSSSCSNVVDTVIPDEKLPPEMIKNKEEEAVTGGVYDVRLSLKGKNGVGRLVLELDSKVLSANSSVFANLISDSRKTSGGGSATFCRIEVPEVENLSVFHETIGLMFEEDITTSLVQMGVSCSIEILEVAAGIMFTKGVLSCLKYLEAVPWSEGEEDKLKSLFAKFTFDDSTTKDVLARLYPPEEINSQQQLVMQLVRSVTNGSVDNSRNELKSLVMSLLSRSSVYEKDLDGGLNKEDLYVVSQSCLSSLVTLFEEASSDSISPTERSSAKPLIERISRQVDNINWLLEILLDQHMAEEFVDVWADQGDLLRMHERVSPMVRYELSRVTAWVFVALGTGKLHCRSETRCGVIAAWFVPMLVDFGWLQRCKKGLDIKVLEDAMGQALLTLPMNHQQFLFMEWFHNFSKHGTECPNLSKAFQIWWRRSSRSHESHSLDSR